MVDEASRGTFSLLLDDSPLLCGLLARRLSFAAPAAERAALLDTLREGIAAAAAAHSVTPPAPARREPVATLSLDTVPVSVAAEEAAPQEFGSEGAVESEGQWLEQMRHSLEVARARSSSQQRFEAARSASVPVLGLD